MAKEWRKEGVGPVRVGIPRDGLLHHALERRLVQVVSALLPRHPVHIRARCGKPSRSYAISRGTPWRGCSTAPRDVGLLRAGTVVASAQGRADAIEEARFWWPGRSGLVHGGHAAAPPALRAGRVQAWMDLVNAEHAQSCVAVG